MRVEFKSSEASPACEPESNQSAQQACGCRRSRELDREDEDRRRYRRFRGRLREADEAERSERQRHAVSQREGRERPEEPAASANQQQQAEHEQEMVEAREDVLDAEMDVARKDRGGAFALRYREVRLVRTEHRPEATAVGERDAKKNVGAILDDAGDREMPAHHTSGRALDRPADDRSGVEPFERRLAGRKTAFGKDGAELRSRRSHDRRPPLDRQPSVADLGDVEERWSEHVGERRHGRRGREREETSEKRRPFHRLNPRAL